MEQKGVIQVPAFDSRYYKVGMPIEVHNRGERLAFHGVIKAVDHREISVVGVTGNGDTIILEIKFLDFLQEKVSFNYRPPVGWDNPFTP